MAGVPSAGMNARHEDGLDLSRRRFLRLAGGVAGGALTISLAAACAPTSPGASPTRPAGAAPTGTSAPAANAGYPSYLASTGGPKPDFPAPGPGYDDGFNT